VGQYIAYIIYIEGLHYNDFKHNKKRNTIILYETLIRELTKSILEENEEKKKKVLSILKEFFSNNQVEMGNFFCNMPQKMEVL
jgi:hypothetical protein